MISLDAWGSAMFGHVAIVLMMHIMMSLSTQATQLSCNSDIHYRMYSSGKLVKCVDCRTCGLGLQPDPPCGIIIGKNTSVGPCKPCSNGYFSSKKDTKNCEKCQSESCFPHQVIEGTCTRTSDTSKCIDKCVTGYQMNAYQTKCVRNKPDNSTTTTTPPSNHPMTPMKSPPISPSINPPTTTPEINSPPPTSMLTPSTMDLKTKPSTILITHYTTTEKPEVLLDHTHNDSSLSTGVVITIIIAVLIVIIVIMVILVWYLRKTQDPRGFGAGLQCAKPHAGGEENVRFIKEEEHKETGLPSSKMHCSETSGGFESSKPPDAAVSSNNINPTSPDNCDALIYANGTNMANSSGISPSSGNKCMVIEMPVHSSAKSGLLEQVKQPQAPVNGRHQSCAPQLTDSSISIPSLPQPSYVPNNTVVSFSQMPYGLFAKIEETFETLVGVKSWKDLAAWLGLNLNDVQQIKNKDSKTCRVIQTWEAEAGNDVPKFESILREKKMTGLADEIKAWLQSLNPRC